eukprot:m.11134 g.11134  ORF g.11134 m.11134 type:complete len:85 (+) comp23001_c0_seq1:457-711(+)
MAPFEQMLFLKDFIIHRSTSDNMSQAKPLQEYDGENLTDIFEDSTEKENYALSTADCEPSPMEKTRKRKRSTAEQVDLEILKQQ